ncbi:MAG: hypothetical protein K6D94_00935 [Clostridiales bacterium]|nr:hypothetical protein [Clostridiales bacterium]
MKYRTIPLLLSALLLTSCDYSFLPQVQDTETAETEANASFETALTETAASEETSAAAED